MSVSQSATDDSQGAALVQINLYYYCPNRVDLLLTVPVITKKGDFSSLNTQDIMLVSLTDCFDSVINLYGGSGRYILSESKIRIS